MIDYSVFMMGNPMDVDAAQKAYAKAQVSEIMPFSQFVKHIADHNGVFTRGTVKGVIADMCECLVEMLLEGKKVQLAELGNFWISIGSEGAEDLNLQKVTSPPSTLCSRREKTSKIFVPAPLSIP